MKFAAAPRILPIILGLSLIGCDGVPAGPQDKPNAIESRLSCRASIRKQTVTCNLGRAGAQTAAIASDLLVGGQGEHVQITGVFTSASGGFFNFDTRIQNLLPQAMNTLDGSTPASGIRVFFLAPPIVTVGTGNIEVWNEDGADTFTGSDQEFFLYAAGLLGPDGILAPGEESAGKPWTLR